MKSPRLVKEDPQISIAEFMKTYNQNIPGQFSRVSVEMLQKFKDTHAALFKHGEMWSVEQHRKRILDWMPLNAPK